MGNESSSLIDPDVPTQTLDDRSLSAVAGYIKSGHAKRIVVLTGAGISTSAGIPDFRSPKTGLYANLARLNLPYAEAVFDISYFKEHPEPFYVLAKELYPGKFFPTVSHAFIALLAKKGLLQMLFTQNIDCLERRAGVPSGKIVEAHGSFATQRCISCKKEFDEEKMLEHVMNGEVPRCEEPGCDGLVKPDIVFFGEALPEAFGSNAHQASMADLVLIIGTSLTVFPFASLPDMTREGKPRVLFNMERVGSIGTRSDDVIELGSCDEGIRKLAAELGWKEELDNLWRDVVGGKEAEAQIARARTAGKDLQDEVDKLAEDVEEALDLEESEHDEDENRYTVAKTKAQDDKGTLDEVSGTDAQTREVHGAQEKPHTDSKGGVSGVMTSTWDGSGEEATSRSKEPPVEGKAPPDVADQKEKSSL